MAYVVDTASFAPDGNVSSIEIELPDHQTDDYIVVIFGQEGGTATFSATGYTVEENPSATGGGGNTTGFLYKKATSSSEANPIVSSTRSDASSAICLIIRDADPTTFVDVSSSVSATSGDLAVPSITTTTNDALIITWAGHRNVDQFQWTNKGCTFYGGNTANQVFVRTSNLSTAGLIASETVYQTTSSGRTRGILAINNKSGGIPAQNITGGASYVLQCGLIDPMTLPVALSTRVSTINAINVQTPSSITINNDNAGSGKSEFNMVSTISANCGTGSATQGEWSGYVWVMGGADLNSTNSFFSNYRSGLQYNFTTQFSYYFEDGLGNWVVKEFLPLGESTIEDEPLTWFGDFRTLPTVDSSGTMDWTDIDYMGVAYIMAITNNSNRNNAYWHIGKDGTYVFTGGGINPRFLSEQSTFDYSFNKQYSQGLAQDVITQSIQIGDGTNQTDFNAVGSSLEHKSADELFTIPANTLGFTIYGSDNCSFDFSQSILITELRQDFTIHASSSLLADYKFNACIIDNYKVTWLSGVNCGGASFIDCDQVDGKASAFTNCTFAQASPDTATSALKIEAGASVTNSTFKRGGETYAIEIGDAGTYEFGGTTWTGYTSDLNVTATTGTVTINLAVGDTEPTYVTAGATVTINLPQATSSAELIAAHQGFVWVDMGSPYSGITENLIGTTLKPVNNVADALSIANQVGLVGLKAMSDITINTAVNDFYIESAGGAKTLTFGSSSSVAGSVIKDFEVTGTQSGEATFENCSLKGLSGMMGVYDHCRLKSTTITLDATTTSIEFLDCKSSVAGTAKPVIDINGATGCSISIGGYWGGLEFTNCTDAGNAISIDMGSGSPKFSSTCTAGEAVVRGVGVRPVDESTGAFTVTSGFAPTYQDVYAASVLRTP